MSVKGKWTPCDLSRTEVLPFFNETNLFTVSAAQMSLELAATAYDMNTDEWLQAGWTDFSFQVDHKLFTGTSVNPSSNTRLHNTWSKLMNTLAQHRVNRDNPLSQLRETLRQRQNSDGCKAVTMLKKQKDGTYLVAIGFMGTGRRVYDWIPNFRLQRKDGLHLGFLQLSQGFEDVCDRILFPNTADELHLPKLTLKDILLECTKSDSRFKIWMSGHSQGSAVMQVFTHRMMSQGVLSRNLFGCGFASPSVADGPLTFPVQRYPIIHLLNSDDVVPRVGARQHFGTCMVMNVTPALRSTCYGKDNDSACFQSLLCYSRTIVDTRNSFLFILAILHALLQLDDAQSLRIVADMMGFSLPEMWQNAIGNQMDFFSSKLYHRARRTYLDITGETAVPLPLLYKHIRRIRSIVRKYGVSAFSRTVSRALGQPHHLHASSAGIPSVYQCLVNEDFQSLRPFSSFVPPCLALPTQVYPLPRRKPFSRFAPLLSKRNLKKITLSFNLQTKTMKHMHTPNKEVIQKTRNTF